MWKHTVVHPFMVSDNRHYIFYIFKDLILVRPFQLYHV